MTLPSAGKLWLDWQRGLAVLFMVEVHVARRLARARRAATAPLYHALRMLGGFAAPGFLFMAGLSQALADAAPRSEGRRAGARAARRALRRALWLLGVAYGFRAVEYRRSAAPGGAARLGDDPSASTC